jgi:DNA-binding NarL/FixJ family response regulator
VAELRWPMMAGRITVFRAARALLTGTFDEADRWMHQSAPDRRTGGERRAESAHLWQLSVLRAECEGPAQALVTLHEAVQHYPAVPAFRAAAAWALGACGRRAEAQQALEELAGENCAGLWRDPLNGLAGLSYLAELCALLGDRAHAALLYDLLLPHAGLSICFGSVVHIRGSAARYLGALAGTVQRWDAAERHFAAALAADERLGAWPAVAHTQREYAALLLARGRPGDAAHAQSLLATALEAARRLGMAPLATLIAKLTSSSSAARRPHPDAQGTVRSPRRAGAGDGDPGRENSGSAPLPDGLTVREAEILGLLAAGLTSTQIATTLVLALPTVRRHIANLYTKIGAHSRAEAAVYAIAHGLGPTPAP